MCSALARLGLLRELEPIYSDVAMAVVRRRVLSECAGRFEGEKVLDRTVAWVLRVAHPWIREVVAGSTANPDSAATRRDLNAWRNRLVFHAMREFAALRISEIFDLVVAFPDSRPALQDLRRALDGTETRPLLASTLRSVLHRRLLHQGAQTRDVLEWYIKAIRAMRILDPRGIVLAQCGAGVRRYLRSREDTVRCIITAILDDASGETFASEGPANPPQEPGDRGGEEEQEDDAPPEDWNDPAWEPAPVEADAATLAETKHAADIMATLISIYDSKEVFIREFQTLLADRLLAVRGYDAEREVRNLEMLKLRFGEGALASCEVMVKDLADSKRLDAILHRSAVLPTGVPVHSMVLSRLYWPTFREDCDDEPLKLPEPVERTLAGYAKGFSSYKASRSLSWKPQLGSVDLELEMADGRVLEFSDLTPLQATLIHCFQERPQWSLEELAETTAVDADTLRRKIGFWVGHGLVREKRSEPGVFLLVEDAGTAASTPRESLGSREGASPPLAGRARALDFERRMRRLSGEGGEAKKDAGAQQGIEDMRPYSKFVLGILRNLGAMPAEQIHTRLTPFYNPPRALADTKRLLDVMLVEDNVDLAGGLYSFKKL
ncbi:hypothetical protein DFJ74DRAFT_600395 [Hyaloraphidium curvatum]|nr:hypothetical protein DFJ74DRAFT_600395 [Hyaloraphidium curvatum]